MASYYYLMSSLPMLKSDGEMPFGYGEFLKMCRGNVSSSKYDMLENLTPESSNGPLVSEWAKFYGVFKAELTYQRNQRLGKPAEIPYERDESTVRAISAAIGDPNPLNAENVLLSIQFDRLDDLIGIHNFDDESLFGYALKLKLLERKTVFDKQKGKAEFDRIVDVLQQQIMSIE